MINASIITIGDELLIGQVIDTNSSWIAQVLLPVGIPLVRRLSIGDSETAITDALDLCLSDSDVVLITGGLGPTADDITKPSLCKYFGGELVMNEALKDHITHLFEKLNRPVTQRNLEQAVVPDNCEVIPNKLGTAAGMLFRKANKIIISMPGVPFEMKAMMEESVIPILSGLHLKPVLHKTLMVAGIPESTLADMLMEFENNMPPQVKLAYLPNFGLIRLRLTAQDIREEKLEQLFNDLKEIVSEYLIIDEDVSIEGTVARKLLQHKASLATAESCTGGYLAQKITAMPGASTYFYGSLVSYANSVKEHVLHVRPSTIEQHGAVSEAVVKEMLFGVIDALEVDYGIALSGIMGPSGGTPEKPVGTVWIAAGSKKFHQTKKINLRYNRQNNIEAAAIQGFLLLLQTIR